MSALARYFMSLGSAVSGYDLTQTPLTLQLEQEGVSVFYKDDPVQLPSAIDLAVITPAIPVESKLLAALQSRNVRSLKRSQVLGKLSEEYFTVAIAGTHGKTTITALTAQIFQAAGLPFMAFIGGIANNFNSNLVLKPDAHILLVEADEFDRSFLTLSPDIALISSVEADHLDIYGSHEQLIAGFVAFANCLPSAGKLVLQQDQQLNVAQGKLKYGTAAQADVFASGMDIKDGKQYFKLHWPDNQTADIVFPMPGIHNLNNALAAATLAYLMGLKIAVVAQALEAFRGVKRRFDIRLNNANHYYVDDYAHHPTEIKACLSALRSLFPEKKITAVFQPHLFSRTRDLMDEFANSFADADQLLLLDIYPAREKPVAGIDSAVLLKKIKLKEKWQLEKSSLLPKIELLRPEVLVTMGAGDIDRFVEPIEKMMASW